MRERSLILPLKGEYFDQIQAGTKTEEYRLCTPYWGTRLAKAPFASVVLTKGYPPADDASRRLVRPWQGYTRKTITHPHFGPEPVEVYAIDVSTAAALLGAGEG